MSKCILIIDDDAVFRTIVKHSLSHPSVGYHVVEAANAAEGLSKLGEFDIDTILLDYELGEANGLQLLNAIIALEHHNIPVIMLSANADDNLMYTCLNRGAQDYLVKQEVTKSTLVRAIRYAEERSRTLRKLDYLANHDQLTGIANRGAFIRHLESNISPARKGQTFALLYIDIDDFKPINDIHGHQVGDAVLRMVAKRIRTSVRKLDYVARIGGDEFTVLMNCTKEELYTKDRAERLLANLTEHYEVGDLSIIVSCSIGIASYPQDGKTPDELMRKADIAMYRSKRSGKSQCLSYGEKGHIKGIINNDTMPTTNVSGKPMRTKSTKL